MSRKTGQPRLYHRNGIWWNEAPRPWRWHRCTPWTKGWIAELTYVERCACGAVRMGTVGPWLERNSR